MEKSLIYIRLYLLQNYTSHNYKSWNRCYNMTNLVCLFTQTASRKKQVVVLRVAGSAQSVATTSMFTSCEKLFTKYNRPLRMNTHSLPLMRMRLKCIHEMASFVYCEFSLDSLGEESIANLIFIVLSMP